ncbi:MAG: hypothetical protein ABF242_01865 [Flavobacteriales bacterium]
MKKYLLYLTSAIILGSCASSRFVEPLHKGEQAVAFDVGGPLIGFGDLTIPIPLTSVVYGRGIDSNLTVFGSLHLTSLLFTNLQTDFGATYRFYESSNEYIPSFSASANGNFIWDMNDTKVKFWPQLDINAYWHFGKNKHYLYAGVSNWWELASTRSQDRPQLDRWLVNPQLGFVYKAKKWFYSIETKFLAPNQDNVNAFVPYVSFLGNRGANGIYLGVGYKF